MSRTRPSGGQHLEGDRAPAAPRAPTTSPQQAHLPVLTPLGCSRHGAAPPSFSSKPSPREGAGGWSQMRLSPCHRPPRHLYSAEGGCRSEARRLAAGQAGCLPAGEVTGSAAGLAHPWDRSMLSQEGNELSGQGYHAQGQAIPCQDSSSHGPKERAPAGDPAPNPAQSKGDGLRGRPSPWRFAASWFPELA